MLVEKQLKLVEVLYSIKKFNGIAKACLLFLLIQFIAINLVHGQMPYATYYCRVGLNSQGDGKVFVTYAVFSGDQPLQISSEEIVLFPSILISFYVEIGSARRREGLG